MFGSYPADIQAAGPEYGWLWATGEIRIPLRRLVPLRVENLLVVGKSASYDSPAGSARTIPVGISAAGLLLGMC